MVTIVGYGSNRREREEGRMEWEEEEIGRTRGKDGMGGSRKPVFSVEKAVKKSETSGSHPSA